mmetsp:Transcript_23511/g.61842  ORF Transcript_23511/g.61842 Transcript_23511/m.61842 type:complete len:359 (-) Transcript_23511:441-1517(-)
MGRGTSHCCFGPLRRLRPQRETDAERRGLSSSSDLREVSTRFDRVRAEMEAVGNETIQRLLTYASEPSSWWDGDHKVTIPGVSSTRIQSKAIAECHSTLYMSSFVMHDVSFAELDWMNNVPNGRLMTHPALVDIHVLYEATCSSGDRLLAARTETSTGAVANRELVTSSLLRRLEDGRSITAEVSFTSQFYKRYVGRNAFLQSLRDSPPSHPDKVLCTVVQNGSLLEPQDSAAVSGARGTWKVHFFSQVDPGGFIFNWMVDLGMVESMRAAIAKMSEQRFHLRKVHPGRAPPIMSSTEDHDLDVEGYDHYGVMDTVTALQEYVPMQTIWRFGYAYTVVGLAHVAYEKYYGENSDEDAS